MAWTTITYSFGSVLTSTKMTQNQDNFTAVAQGLSGAPKIQTAALEQTAASEAVTTATIRDLAVTDSKLSISAITTSKLADAAVTQVKLSTTTGAVSVGAGGAANLTLPGGTYGWYPQTAAVSFSEAGQTATIANATIGGTLPTSYTAIITLTGGASYGLAAQQRYVQASPPYDLGDGEIPLFVFVKVNALGNVLATYVAPEAPWHYNGPTDIRAERYSSDRRGYRKVKQFFAEHGNIQSARQSGMTRDQIAQAIADSPMVEIELTQDIKNADMPLIPHPFCTLGAGESVVLIDPVSTFVVRACRLHDGGESICDLLHSGEIVFGNTDLPRNKPPGVLAVAPRWKLT